MTRHNFGAQSAAGASVVLACALLSCGTPAVTSQSRGTPQPASEPAVSQPAVSQPAVKHSRPATTPGAAAPFGIGEHLVFRVLWSKYAVNAATLEFSVEERRDFFGRAAWHFRAHAQTVGTTGMVYPLDDKFDSYVDVANLTGRQYEMHLHEMGKQEDNSWRMIAGNEPAPPGVSAARVLPETRDPIGLLYALRATDWKSTPELRAPVFDGHHLYNIVARLQETSGQVTVPAGQFAASRIDVQVSENGKEISETHFSLWLAHDAARTPVLIEAETPIGAARVELTAKP